MLLTLTFIVPNFYSEFVLGLITMSSSFSNGNIAVPGSGYLPLDCLRPGRVSFLELIVFVVFGLFNLALSFVN